MSTPEFCIAALTVAASAAILLACGALTPQAVLGALLAAAAAAWWLARKFSRRIGGYTGDCLGAVQQLSEAAVYIAVLATLGHGALA